MKMVKPVLKRIHYPDLMPGWENNFDPEKFCFLAQAMFGPEGEHGEESFSIKICSPGWLMSELDNRNIISGRNLLVMKEFNMELIEAYLKRATSTITEKSWSDVATKLSKFAHWEFEDYSQS